MPSSIFSWCLLNEVAENGLRCGVWKLGEAIHLSPENKVELVLQLG
jgi:hypothetical protein